MNHKKIVLAKKRYHEFSQRNEELKRLKAQLDELKNNSNGMSSLELVDIENREVYDAECILHTAFSSTFFDESDNIIFVYMGAFSSNFDSYSTRDIRIADINKADYLLYRCLENSAFSMRISPVCQESFESTHTVLRFSTFLNIENKFHDLQTFYYSELLKDDVLNETELIRNLHEKCKK